MDFIRAYRFRIYPDLKRQSEINLQLNLSKNFYNKLLEKAREGYGKDRSFTPKRSTLNKIKKEIILETRDFLKIYSQTRCEIEDRVIKAYQNFFRRVKEKKQGKKVKVGFPRFKSIDRYHSLTYPQENGSFSIERRNKFSMLRVSRIGRMKIELHRTMEGRLKTLTLKKEAGKYYAIFTTVKETPCPNIEDINPIGIDLGLDSFVVMSDGSKIQKPKFIQERRKRLARWQKIVSRRQKGSKRREKAKLRLEEEWAHIDNQSGDYLHKLSSVLARSGYTSFAVEKLNIQNMARNHSIAGAVYGASWNRFVQLLSYKAESAGLKVISVNPQNTSKICSTCGSIQDMPLSERIYVCNRCGMKKDRDVNAAINILNRATSGQGESHARGDIASTVQQEPQAASLSREHTLPMEIGGGSPQI